MTDIWIIDDEESIRTICTSALEDLFNVESFSSASEALLALNSNKPDLIITDIKMPGMSGLEFLDKVSEKFPNLPTIIITAHANIDNGPGIPEEKLKEIFYPMVTTKNEGMGLGLTIAQSIVMQNSGLIECSSKHRETKFTIVLPIRSYEDD